MPGAKVKTTPGALRGPRDLLGLRLGRGSRGRCATFRRSGGGRGGLFSAFLLLLLLALLRSAFARNELLLGLGELERFALEVLRRSASLADLFMRRLAEP